jgi:hypothetical protein
MEAHIVEGYLVCPGTASRFRVLDGVPDFVNFFDENGFEAARPM